jgi:hypothetical protein
MVRVAMAFDEVGKRIVELEDFDIAGNHSYYHRLKLYAENKEYSVDLKTRNCTVYPPRRPFHPYGVMPGAKFMAEATIGAAGVVGESVTVADFESKDGNETFTMAVSEPSCFPIHHAEFGHHGLEITNFYDAKEGISDPTIWLPPKECKGL